MKANKPKDMTKFKFGSTNKKVLQKEIPVTNICCHQNSFLKYMVLHDKLSMNVFIVYRCSHLINVWIHMSIVYATNHNCFQKM